MKKNYKTSIFGILSLVFLLFLGTTFAVNAQSGPATITTDKEDYVPGEYVIITGSGWEPGETVSFQFEHYLNTDTLNQESYTKRLVIGLVKISYQLSKS